MFNGKWEILCICNWCPFPVVLSRGSTEKNFPLFSLHPPIRLSMYNTKFLFEASLLQSKLLQLSQSFLIKRMIPPFCQLLWPFVGFFPVYPCLSCTREPRIAQRTPGVASPVPTSAHGKEGSLLSTCWQLFS